jgi:PHD/YefM family antitoxin component YafN of YafNO toxin-antitoxin module
MRENNMINNNTELTTITFNNNELDVIYDALTEFENMTDNDQEQNTIHDIFTKIYVANKQHSGNSI